MELHPFLEKGSTIPQTNLWYVLATEGDPPSMRVGATATFVKSKEENGAKVFIIGGANPDGTFAEINVLDLGTMGWDRLDTPKSIGRYEHAVATFTNPDDSSSFIVLFGGAVQSGNLNDVQQYSIAHDRWSVVAIRGNSPSARTQHSMSAFFNNGRLVVYSGGQSGSEPVTDRQTHIFEPATSTWSTPYVSGQPPKPRHGHLIVASQTGYQESGGKVFVHGGMTGNTFYDDLFLLDLEKNQWSELKVGRKKPCSRAAHGGVVWKDNLYIFGGMCKNGALDDMWSFDTKTKCWTEIKYDGPPPPSRLDFACCLVTMSKCQNEGTKELNATCVDDSKPDESEKSQACGSEAQVSTSQGNDVFFLISGGMDTEGNIFDDTLVFMLGSEETANLE